MFGYPLPIGTSTILIPSLRSTLREGACRILLIASMLSRAIR
jgi:hypothetical protein